jgi:hypothetical protein
MGFCEDERSIALEIEMSVRIGENERRASHERSHARLFVCPFGFDPVSEYSFSG